LACWSVLFDRNLRFIGRSTLLAELEGRLAHTARFMKAALVGLGMISKTQTALELAFQTRDQSPMMSVFWVPVLSRDTVRKAF
jgi:cell shape-determining protein MreD